jgi:hypothetical protein
MRALIEYRAVVGVIVDLDAGVIKSAIVRSAYEDEVAVWDVSSAGIDESGKPLTGEVPDETLDRAQRIVDDAGPLTVGGSWAPADFQRASSGDPLDVAPDLTADGEDASRPLQRQRIAKTMGPPLPFASAHPDLPRTHREALRRACVAYVDECLMALEELGRGYDIEDTVLDRHLPPRYAHYYGPLFGKEWAITIATVAWKLAQQEPVVLTCVAEELALNALIEEAKSQLELNGDVVDESAWRDFQDDITDDDDWAFLFDDAMDGIEDSSIGRQMGIGHLTFSEWFRPFYGGQRGSPHPYCLDG